MSVGTRAARFGQAIHSPQAGAMCARSVPSPAAYSARDVVKNTITSRSPPSPGSPARSSVPGRSPSRLVKRSGAPIRATE